MEIDYETLRENRRASVAQPSTSPSVVKETSSSDWTSYRAGEREDSVIPIKKEDKGPTIISSFGGNVPVIVNPVPMIPTPLPAPTSPSTYKVKVATPEIILFDEDSVPEDILIDLVFENIGGQELLSLSRHDTVSGDFISNQLIKNLTSLNQEYSSKKLLSLQNTSDKYFSNFGIKLESKIPFEGNGPDGSNIYVDSLQNIVIELINLEVDEQIEIQLGIDGTIYTITLGATES
jgi:hypothetical protein